MDVLSPQLYIEGPSDTYPLLMARPGNSNGTQHVIDINGSLDASTSTSTHERYFSGIDVSSGSNSRNSSFTTRGDTRRHRSPLNSGFWISIELVLTLSQIITAIVVLSLSRHEHPGTPMFAWIVGYASGCVATLPLLYWRYYHNNHIQEGDSSQSRQTSRINDPSGTLLSSSTSNGGEDVQAAAAYPRNNEASWMMNTRVKALGEYFKMVIDCFFAVWFVVGNVWIFGGHSSADQAPNLYRLCIVFLTFSCIGYAMPFILCATICCCLPCIISILGVREDLTQTRGATTESMNALPTYKFKIKKNKRSDESNSNVGEGGVVAVGTEKERIISSEDAICCICLAKYENDDDLRELPCSHLFHKDCVDKWLKINALCPLCKSEIGENVAGSASGEDVRQQRSGNGVVNGLTNT